MVEIPITEEFDDVTGRLSNYDAYDVDSLASVLGSSHVDVRTFVHQRDKLGPRNMFLLDQISMDDLTLPMSVLDGDEESLLLDQVLADSLIVVGEDWMSNRVVGVPGAPTVVNNGAAGSITPGAYNWFVTAVNENGETTPGPAFGFTVAPGTTTVAVSWAAVTDAVSYNVWRQSGGPADPSLAQLVASGVVGTSTLDGAAPLTPPFTTPPTTNRAYRFTIGPDPARNNWHTLRATLDVGTNTFWSARTDARLIERAAIDLSGFDDTHQLSVTLPGFPLASVNAASSFVDVSFHPNAAFDAGPFVYSIPLTDSDVALVNGNSEFRVDLGTFPERLNSPLRGVRLRIVATGAALFKVAAVRVLPPDWEYLPYSVDTTSEILRSTVSRTGLTTEPYDAEWPILWRAAAPPGVHDPRPVNSSMMIPFNSGSLSPDGVTTSNRVGLYLREEARDYMTQLDLDNMTMEELDALGAQPDSGPAKYRSRTQDELQGLLQTQLQGRAQFDLERAPDELASSWIRVLLTWGSTTTRLTLDDSEGNSYVWDGDPLDAGTRYVAYVDLVDTSIRIRVHPLFEDDTLDRSVTIFDTTKVIDDFLLARRPGRIGWLVDLVDGDAWVEAVRSRGQVFAEWRSAPFESHVPVDGAQIFASASSNRQLYTGVEPNPFSAPEETTYFELDTDHERTTSGESVRITNAGIKSLQGVQSNVLKIEDFAQTTVKFDVWYPTSPIDLGAYLIGANTKAVYDLALPRITPNQWQTIKLDLARLADEPTGPFRLVLLQHELGYPTTWWLDRVSVYERSVSWSARSVLEDPWGDVDAPFSAFGDLINNVEHGVLFPHRDRFLQVRGQAHRQDAWIDTVRFKARYAQLGRLVWEDEADGLAPIADFTHSFSGGVVSFDGRVSIVGSGRIVNYAWSLGDGEVRYGSQLDHEYLVPGNYTVTLTVTTDKGMVASDTQVVTG